MKKCYIIPTEKCSCDCTFCISKSRDYDNKLELSQDRPFLKTKEDILMTLKLRGINRFEITGGGEPFLDKDLNQKVALIKMIIPNAFIKIYTNGNHLKKIIGLDEINISIAHYEDEINKKIMRPKGNYVPLIDKLTFFKENYPNAKIRLSVPLLRDGINNEEEIKKLIENTEQFDVDYVIRTIYPNTPNYEERYVDADYYHPRIKYERDNDVGDFEEIIWWSNNELYADWQLKRKKHLFSYLLLKPDAQTYFNEILNIIEEKHFRYQIRIYQNIKEIMYLYRDKPKEYQKIITAHLRAISSLFGTEFVVLFLNEDLPLSIEDSVLETNKLKQAIRNQYSFTYRHNGTINYDGYNIQANLVHAPDTAGTKFDEDIDFLNTLEYKIPKEKTLALLRKHRTFKI